MIAAPVFPISFFVLLLISALSLVSLLAWFIALAVSRRVRVAFRTKLRFHGPIMAVLAVLSTFVLLLIYGFHRLDVEREQKEAARHIMLTEPATVADIAMPAGTRLHSREPNQPEQFDQADFPQPVSFKGLMVSHLQRGFSPNDQYDFIVSSVEATLAFDQTIDGWLCQKQTTVELDIQTGKFSFRTCILAAGNKLGNWNLPEGVKLSADQPPQNGWTIFLDPDKTTMVRGLPLQDARLNVDQNRQFIGFSYAVLGADLKLGSVFYPAGTRVSATDWSVPNASSDAVIFSPRRDHPAKPDNLPDVTTGKAVVQTLAGDVKTITTNQALGILDVEDFRVIQ